MPIVAALMLYLASTECVNFARGPFQGCLQPDTSTAAADHMGRLPLSECAQYREQQRPC